jgi:uncharacterized membrane protein
MMDLFSKGTEIEGLLFARPLPVIMWTMIAVAIIALTALLYRRERGIKIGLRVSLIAIRIAILLLIVAALFEPTAAIKETHQQKRSLAVLIDSSQSMSVRDQRKSPEDIDDAAVALGFLPVEPTEEPVPDLNTKQRNAIAAASRLDLATSLLSTSAAPIFASLRDDLSVRFYTFGESVEMLGNGESDLTEEILSLKADKQGTSLANAIKKAANGHDGSSLSGIIVLSDGIETGARQPEAVAHDLGVRGIPIYTLPTGVTDPDDISIRNVIVQDVAFVGDTVPVRVQIRSRGYEKRNAELIVHFNEKEVVTQGVVLEGGLQYVDVAFDARVRAKGAVPLKIEIQPFIDEATAENNTVARSVRVVNEKINVLCIEGSARWEFRYLRAILKRDPRINATFIATRAGNELAMHSSDYIARFPEDAEDAFKYDLVVLGDVDSSFFTPGEFARLEELVRERGGSLLMLAGPKYSPSSYENTAVERMLPVRFNAKDKWYDVGKTVHPVLTAEGRSSLVLTLEMDRDKNDRTWAHVSPMDRLPPLLEPRPGASVLATLSDSGARVSPYPLISWQRYGTGKCMLMATDRLWRLRFRTGDKYHWRVWSQCIQFLTLSRLMGEHKQIRMETDRVSYPVGSQVRVYAEVLDDGYEPVLQERYDVFVGPVTEEDDEGNRISVSLRPDSTRPGLYVGYYTPLGAGRYRIQAGEDDLDFANTIEFQVADVRAEMANTDMQLERLQRIAKLSGGKCLRLAQVNELATTLDRTPHETIVRREQSLWDNWFFAILIIVLAGSEWIVRRRFDLL